MNGNRKLLIANSKLVAEQGASLCLIASWLRRCLLPALWLLAAAAPAAEIRIDFSKQTGQIRPLHGGNCGPIQFGELIDLTAHFREIGIPFTRLHDCHWPNPDVVDLHVIFPDFKADPNQPENYSFDRTDRYLEAITNAGSIIIYRLGESIEHSKVKYYVHPPKDYEKWAAICLNLIRHYNEGWANGFRHQIEYWEIWNEPENRPQMWSGSDRDYFRLYEQAARAIKSRFPGLKVGGPSLGYTGKIMGNKFEPGDFMIQFLRYCQERKLPLDFFSWHLYSDDPWECLVRAQGIRRLLDQFGFTKTELHLNEWNYLPNNDWEPMGLKGQGQARERFFEQIGGPSGAAFTACVLINLQDSPVDIANYFMSDNQGFGLFTFHGVPRKNFYAFKAFNTWLATPQRVEARGEIPGQLALGAGLDLNRTQAGILISHYRGSQPLPRLVLTNPPWPGDLEFEACLVDAVHNLECKRNGVWPQEGLDLSSQAKAPTVWLIKLRPVKTAK